MEDWNVNKAWNFLAEAACFLVLHNTNDLDIDYFGATAEGKLATNRLVDSEVFLRHSFIDDRDLRSSKPVRRCKLTPDQDRDPHRREEPRADLVHVGVHVFTLFRLVVL